MIAGTPTGALALTLAAPGWLWLLAAVAGLAVAYVVQQWRRRGRFEVRFTNIELIDVVVPRRPRWRRHVTAAAFLCALVALVVGAARPRTEVEVARERATVVLAIDTSFSMQATDVAPSRLEAAQEAAIDFVESLPRGINVGLVTFDGVALVRVTPTTDRGAVRTAVENLRLGPATAIGEAIFAGLEAIEAAPRGEDGEPVPARLVVMSDGKTTVGRPNESGAAAAAEREVPVSTIAFGTRDGEVTIDGELSPTPVPVEPGPLRDIAEATGGSFFEADSLEGLEAVYEDIGSSVGYVTEEQEVTHRAVLVALGFALVAAVMSLAWFSRLP